MNIRKKYSNNRTNAVHKIYGILNSFFSKNAFFKKKIELKKFRKLKYIILLPQDRKCLISTSHFALFIFTLIFEEFLNHSIIFVPKKAIKALFRRVESLKEQKF